jgi:hypothetical protein
MSLCTSIYIRDTFQVSCQFAVLMSDLDELIIYDCLGTLLVHPSFKRLKVQNMIICDSSQKTRINSLKSLLRKLLR